MDDNQEQRSVFLPSSLWGHKRLSQEGLHFFIKSLTSPLLGKIRRSSTVLYKRLWTDKDPESLHVPSVSGQVFLMVHMNFVPHLTPIKNTRIYRQNHCFWFLTLDVEMYFHSLWSTCQRCSWSKHESLYTCLHSFMWYPHILIQLLRTVLIPLQPHIHFWSCSSLHTECLFEFWVSIANFSIEVDLVLISQFQYKHEVTTYGSRIYVYYYKYVWEVHFHRVTFYSHLKDRVGLALDKDTGLRITPNLDGVSITSKIPVPRSTQCMWDVQTPQH